MQSFNLSHSKRGSSLFSLAFVAAFLTASLAGCEVDFLKNAESYKTDARQSIAAKNYSEAATLAQKLTEKAPADYEGYFLLAQAKAQVGDKNAALAALEQSIKKGLKDDEQIDKNVNLDPIKTMTAYKDLMVASFPSRKAALEPLVSATASATISGSESSSSVSIHQVDGKQVVRAGDVVIEMPSAK